MGSRGPLPRVKPARPSTPCPPMPPPSWLPPAAAAIWAEVEPRLRDAGRLRPEHEELLAAWVCTAAELRELSATIAAVGSVATGPHGRHPSPEHSAAQRARATLLAIGKVMGLDPISAGRLDDAQPQSEDEDDDVLARFAALRSRPQPADDPLRLHGAG